MESGSASPLGRKDRGSHPVPGSGLKQRGQREERCTTGRRPVNLQFRSRIKTFVNNHLLDPDFFLGGRRMNFHKTIGFLAALLLTLGLGVPDSFAQTTQAITDVELSFSPASIPDSESANLTLSVTVTLQEAVSAATTVTVTLSDVTATGTNVPADERAESGEYGFTPNIAGGSQTVLVTIPKDSNTGSNTQAVLYQPGATADTDADDEKIAIQGAAAVTIGTDSEITHTSPKADLGILTLTDSDNNITDVALSFSPASIPDNVDANLTLSVTVTLEQAVSAATTVTVTLSDVTATGTNVPEDERAESGEYAFTPDIAGGSQTVLVTIPKDSNTGSNTEPVLYRPGDTADTDGDDEKIAIQGAAAVTIGGLDLSHTSPKADLGILTLTDSDNNITDVALSFSPASVPDNADANLTLSVAVTLEQAVSAATTVTVTLSDVTATGTNVPADERAESGEYTFIPDIAGGSQTVLVTIPKDSNTGSNTEPVLYRPGDTADTDGDDEKIAIQGAAAVTIGGLDLSHTSPKADLGILTLTDSDNNITDVALSFSPASVPDNKTTGVTIEASVTLKKAVSAATTVTVTLSDVTQEANAVTGIAKDQAEAGEYTFSPAIPASGSTIAITVTIPKDSNTGSDTRDFLLNPVVAATPDADDDDEKIAIQGEAAATIGGQATTKTTPKADLGILTVIDAANVPVTGLSLAVDPMSIQDTDGATTVTVTATVTLGMNTASSRTITVALELDAATNAAGVSSLDDISSPAEVDVDIDAGANEGSETFTFVYDPMAPGATGEMIVISGEADGIASDPNAILNIVDSEYELAANPLSLSFDPVGPLSETTDPTRMTLSVQVSLAAAVPVSTMHTVVLSLDATNTVGANFLDVGIAPDVGSTMKTVMVTVPANQPSGTETLTFVLPGSAPDADGDDETLAIKGMLGSNENVASLTITDTSVSLAATNPLTLSFDPAGPLSETDGATDMGLVAMVTLTANAKVDVTHTVTLSLDATNTVGNSLSANGITVTTLDVTVPVGQMSGSATLSFSLDPTEDADTADETLAIKGMIGSDAMDVASLTITDTSVPLATQDALALSLSPTELSETVGATDVTLSAVVTLSAAAKADVTHTVTLSLDATNTVGSSLSDIGITVTTLDVIVPAGQMSHTATLTFSFDPEEDTNTADETLAIKGMLGTDVMDVASLTIKDRTGALAKDANDADGFRVITTAPAVGKWAKVGANQVKVQILRKHGPAADWGNFSSIAVSLHNVEDNPATTTVVEVSDALYTLTANDDEKELSNLSAESVRTDTLDSVMGSGLVAYKRRQTGSDNFDTLEFRFQIPNSASAADVTEVFARATFTSDNGPFSLESRDTKTSILPNSPSVFPDKVGDGKYIKIDRSKPANSIITSLTTTTRKGDAVAPVSGRVGTGTYIKTVAQVDEFRETKVVFQIIATQTYSVDGTVVVKANGALVGYSKPFSALEIYNAGSTLTDSVKVISGLFKRKYTANDPDADKARFKKNGTFEDDNVMVKVRAVVHDKAGNTQPQAKTSPVFTLDSKLPKVTIQYPKPSASDSVRFTAGISQDYDFLVDGTATQKLKPLKFKVDEGTSLAWVVIGGIGTDVDTLVAAASDNGAEAEYDLGSLALKNPKQVAAPDKANKHPTADAGAGGSNVTLTVVVKDQSGNKGITTVSGAVFDSKAPTISRLFPNNADLGDIAQIGGSGMTQHPVFRINEQADSITVRYQSAERVLTKVGTDPQLSMVNDNINVRFTGDDALQQNETYSLQVYVRDLAHNVSVSDEQTNLTFNSGLHNPQAGGFRVYSHVRDNTKAKGAQSDADYGVVDGKIASGQMDSVVAGQALRLTIIAIDTMLTRQSGSDRKAVTYSNAGVKVVAMDSNGGMVSSVSYWGKGVTDNGDGSATLDGNEWLSAERTVFMMSQKAIGPFSVVVKDMTAAGVLNFMGKKDGLVVDAADFTKFVMSAWDDGQEVKEVWGSFDLLVVPTDKYGNPSLKTFFDQTPKTGGADSLNILDTRLKNSGNSAKAYDMVDIEFSSTLLEDLPLVWSALDEDGDTLPVYAAERPNRTLQVRTRIDNSFLDDNDARSRNNSGDLSLKIMRPLTPVLTLWVPGSTVDEAGNDVVIPADPGTITVTVAAEGYTAGDMVTFTKNGTAMDPVAANDDGNAKLDITMSEAGTVTVSATDGRYSADELTITFVEGPAAPARQSYADANGDPVYLIYTGDAPSDPTVGVDDFLALVAAFMSNDGDDNYNAQADVNDDGTVNVDDFLEFLKSWGRTAAGPATKPLVLLPGINENAEFSLSLGSERVVAGELVAVDVSLANVAALVGYGFALNYENDKFEFVSVAPADEDLLKSTGGETLFHHIVSDGQVTVANGLFNGTAVSGGGDVVRFVFRVLREFEDNARFEIADGLVFDPGQLSNPAVVAGVLELQSTPREFALHQNFPNPFNPDTTIKYDLAESADVTLQIYNVLGQVIRTLVASEAQNAGRYQIRWNGMDDRGVPVSSGIYFYQISADGKFSDVRKLMLLK